jgi:hypothetical protein
MIFFFPIFLSGVYTQFIIMPLKVTVTLEISTQFRELSAGPKESINFSRSNCLDAELCRNQRIFQKLSGPF